MSKKILDFFKKFVEVKSFQVQFFKFSIKEHPKKIRKEGSKARLITPIIKIHEKIFNDVSFRSKIVILRLKNVWHVWKPKMLNCKKN